VTIVRLLPFALCAAAAILGTRGTARADDDNPQALFLSGAKALQEGRAADAIAAFEALADRGVVDPAASFDRGLAYASRVRIGAEVPGDLGRAAHGFEEARGLSKDPKLVAEATRALELVRSEVARRRARAGQPVEVDYGRSLGRAVASLIPEDAWACLAVFFSASLAMALFARWLSRSTRGRAAGAIIAGVSAPSLCLAVAMTLASRHDRHDLREAVVLADARPIDGRGIAIIGATSLPEGARVEVIDADSAAARVRFGASDARVPRASIRELARRD
jgi:hypothetical protein